MKNNILILLMIILPQLSLAKDSNQKKSQNWQGYYMLDDDGESLYGVAGSFEKCSRKGTGVIHVINNKQIKRVIVDELLGEESFQERIELPLDITKIKFHFIDNMEVLKVPKITIDRNFEFLPKTVFKYEGTTFLFKNSVARIDMERLRDLVRFEIKEDQPFIYITRRDTRYRDYYREGVFTRCRYKKIDENAFVEYLKLFDSQIDQQGFIQTQ